MTETGFRKNVRLSFHSSSPALLRPLALAIIGGVLGTLSWPWPGLWPLCFVTLTPLIIAVDGQSGRRAFLLGWVYGLSLALTSLPWITDVLAGYGGLGLIIGWAVVALLSAYLAIYPALFAWIITLRIDSHLVWVLLGSATWCGLNWLQNFGALGFNWTPLAGPLILSPELSQAADLVGFYGLGFFVAFINFSLAVYFFKIRDGIRKIANRYLAFSIVLLIVGFGYGLRQHAYWENIAKKSPTKVIVAVQPSTDQAQKWDEVSRDRILVRYANLAKEAATLSPWLTIWPETAMPFIYDHAPAESDWLEDLGRKTGGQSLVGIVGFSGYWPEMKLHNRMILFQDGQPGPYYDKKHLVPFGEYLPFSQLSIFKWAFVQGLIGAAGTYSPGETLAPVELPLEPNNPNGDPLVQLGILTCFESIFPNLARDKVLEGADLLVVPTNDAWFGRSRAPLQHLFQSSMRAIETRRAVVRVGNTGISGVIHPSGNLPWQSKLYDVGVFPLPTPILSPENLTKTFFVRYGYFMAPLMAILAALLAVVRLIQSRK